MSQPSQINQPAKKIIGDRLFEVTYFAKYKVSASGFTLVEVLVALAIGVAVYLLFTQSLTMLLQARDESKVRRDITQSADRITTIFSQIGQTATRLDVIDGNAALEVIGKPCRLLRWVETTKSLGYAEDGTDGCSPPATPTTNLNLPSVNVTAAEFIPLPQAEDAKSVRFTFTLSSTRAFAADTVSFATTVSIWGK